jgi:hypothetical protein
MKYFITISLFLSTFNLVFSQNLISNGGFEDGTSGWGGWWSRDGKGSVNIVSSPVYSGINALEVTYDGDLDWSYSVNKTYPVKPGDIYELSAWVNSESINSDAQLSVVLRDSLGKVINWVYGTCSFEETNGLFKQFTSSFIVPEKVGKIVPRFIGSNPCHIFVDDISMKFLGNSIISAKTYTLENEKLKTVISYPSMKISTLSKVNGQTYVTEPLYEYMVTSVDTSEENLLILNAHHITKNIDFTFVFSLSDNSLDIQLMGDSSMVLKNNLKFPGTIASNLDDYLVVPRGTGIIWPVTENYPYWAYNFWEWKSTMSFIGVTNFKSGYMIASDDPWDTEASFNKSVQTGLLNPEIVHHSAKGNWGYNRTLHYVFVNDGYIEMCQWYKQFAQAKGYRKTLSQKAIDNPAMNRLKGAVDFWAIMMDFTKKDGDIFLKYGIDRAIISMNTWGSSLPKLIDSLNSKGFLTSRYDIFTDVWPDSVFPGEGYRREGFPEDVIVKKDGSLQEGWLAYVDEKPFQGYVICSETHSEFANKEISTDLAVNHYNCRFIDVELASGLKECYSSVHPVTRKTDAQARIEALNVVKNGFNLVTGDEEARDFAFPVVDYGEGTMTINPQVGAGYDWANPIDTIGDYYQQKNLNPAMRVPLHGLVYHDVHIPTWYTGDGASKVPSCWDDKDLFNILYASMPLFMPPNRTYWNTNFERFLTSYHLISSINRNIAFEKMTSHSFLSNDKKIQQTTFSNGWEVTVNFDTIPHTFNTVQLAAKGFYASNGNRQVVFRIVDSNSTLAVADIDNRLFINPYGTEKTYKGIKTPGAVFLRNDGNDIHLAFIGNQKYFLFNPSEMEWKPGHAFSETTGNPIPLISMDEGWCLLNRPENESFVRFDLDTTALSVNQIINPDELFECYPNPANDNISVKFELQNSENVRLTLYNLFGQPVKELLNKKCNIGLNRYDFELEELLAGSYILKLSCKRKNSLKLIVKP